MILYGWNNTYTHHIANTLKEEREGEMGQLHTHYDGPNRGQVLVTLFLRYLVIVAPFNLKEKTIQCLAPLEHLVTYVLQHKAKLRCFLQKERVRLGTADLHAQIPDRGRV